MRTRRLDPTATPEYRAVMGATVLICALSVLGSIVPAVDRLVTLAMLGLGGLGAGLVVLRLLVRFVRERIDDAADARTAAAWRAAHLRAADSRRTPMGVP